MSYDKMKTIELRALVRRKSLAHGASVVSATKAQLLELLEGGADLPEPTMRDPLADLLAEALQGKIEVDIDETRVIQLIKDHTKEHLDETRIAEIVRRHLDEMVMPTIVHVKTRTGEIRDMGIQHKQFSSLLTMSQARDKDGRVPPLYLYGPVGTGKTTAAQHLATALGLKFYFNGAIDSEYKLSGFIDAGGTFQGRPFYEAYANGGVYLFDELDSSLPSAVLAFNAALASGYADFPIGKVERHPDCIIIAAGNTTLRGDGYGEGFQRNEMDSAFRDRFIFLSWPIDEELEAACVPPDKESQWWLRVVREARAATEAHKIKRHEITPRATFNGLALLGQGVERDAVVDSCIRKGLPEEAWEKIRRSVKSYATERM